MRGRPFSDYNLGRHCYLGVSSEIVRDFPIKIEFVGAHLKATGFSEFRKSQMGPRCSLGSWWSGIRPGVALHVLCSKLIPNLPSVRLCLRISPTRSKTDLMDTHAINIYRYKFLMLEIQIRNSCHEFRNSQITVISIWNFSKETALRMPHVEDSEAHSLCIGYMVKEGGLSFGAKA